MQKKKEDDKLKQHKTYNHDLAFKKKNINYTVIVSQQDVFS